MLRRRERGWVRGKGCGTEWETEGWRESRNEREEGKEKVETEGDRKK